MMIVNPCYCIPVCLQYEDTFDRTNNPDINVDSPFTWTPSGTTSIASNRLSVSANSSAIMTDSGIGLPGQRVVQVSAKGASGDKIRIFAGDHYVEIIPGAATSMGIYNSGGTMLMLRSFGVNAMSGNVDYTITVGYGPVSEGTAKYMGIAVETNFGSIALPCTVSGVTFGVGAGSSASAVSFDYFQLIQHDSIRSTGTPNCSVATATGCASFLPTVSGIDFTATSGSWTLSSGSAAVSTTGLLKFSGKLPENDNARFVAIMQTALVSGGYIWSAWTDYDTTTGIRCTTIGSDWSVEIVVNGSTMTTIGSAMNASSKIECRGWISNDRFYYEIINNTAGTQIQEGDYSFSGSDAQCIPALEVTANIGTPNSAFVMSGSSSYRPGPGITCSRGSTDDSPWCSGTVPDYDVLIDDIIGDAGDVANINGVAFRVGTTGVLSGSLDVGGTLRFYVISISWNRNGSDRRLSVHFQFDNAWALFEMTVNPAVACNSIDHETLSLVDYESSSLFDMSAATCEIDAV